MDKALTLLGFARKAGKLSCGMEAVKEAMNRKKARLALAAADISEKSKKEIRFFAEKNRVGFTELKRFDSKALSDAIGRRCSTVTINDSGFADAFLKAYDEGGNANDK